ncbi:MAG TPA: tetratricopeptide repeat protein, partial [Kofleriaceae bacterium]|nr:tetratricopeptide repeat protein [Kofleriaceae bacterium]
TIGDVQPCADASQLAHRAPLPGDPARRASITAALARAREMNAVVSLGTPLPDTAVAALVADARTLDYAPLTAFALAIEARQSITATHSDKAEQVLEQAVIHAETGGDDALRFELELALGRLVGLDFERFDDGRHHLDRASALLKRIGGGPSREAQVLDVVALVELRRGRLSVAEQESRSSLAKPGLPELDRAKYLQTLGYILIDADRPREAKSAFDEGLAIDERLLGSRHPRTGSMHEGLGGAYRHQHKYDDARRELALGLDILQSTFGPDSFDTGVALANLATLDDSTKHYDVAETEMRQAFEIYKKVYGPNSSRTWRLLWRLGAVQNHAHHFDDAETTLLGAVAGLRGVFGDNHRQVSDVYFELGKLETNRKRPAAAIPYFDAGAASLRASEGPTSKLLRRMYSGRGDAHSDLKQWPLACADYEAAIAVAGEDPTGGSNRADLELSYAEALFNANRRTKALEMAKSARQRFETLAATDDVKEADNWIKSKFPSER